VEEQEGVEEDSEEGGDSVVGEGDSVAPRVAAAEDSAAVRADSDSEGEDSEVGSTFPLRRTGVVVPRTGSTWCTCRRDGSMVPRTRQSFCSISSLED